MSSDQSHPEPRDSTTAPDSAAPCIDLDDNPTCTNISIKIVLSLLRAMLALKLLRTGASILHPHKSTPLDGRTKSSFSTASASTSLYSSSSSLSTAISRREKQIMDILSSMTLDENSKPPVSNLLAPSPAVLSPVFTLPSTIVDNGRTHDTSAPVTHMSIAPPLAMELAITGECPPSPQLATLETYETGSEEEEGKEVNGDTQRKRVKQTTFYSSLPPPFSDSIYSSSLRRSLSVSNVPSISSCAPQGMIVSAAQYTRILSERKPQSSTISQPLSINSLLVNSRESSRVNRSQLELVENSPYMGSVDSFPGQFPVSDGVELSSLATVAQHLRINSVRTSVRPFSDL